MKIRSIRDFLSESNPDLDKIKRELKVCRKFFVRPSNRELRQNTTDEELLSKLLI